MTGGEPRLIEGKPLSLRRFPHPRVEARKGEEREERGGDETSDHHDRERAFQLASPDADEHREEPQDRRAGRHQLRPHAPERRLAKGFLKRGSACDERLRLRDEDEAVLDRDAEEADDADD